MAAALSCLEKDPERRPPDARALQDALDAADMPRWTEADARARWAASALLAASSEGTSPTDKRLRPVGSEVLTPTFHGGRR